MTPVRDAIPNFAGYADPAARGLSDRQVRAYAGERLADLRERLGDGGATAIFDDAMLHCEFGDQRALAVLGEAHFAEAAAATVESEDERVLAAVGGSESVEAAGLAAFVTAVRDALVARVAAIVALKG